MSSPKIVYPLYSTLYTDEDYESLSSKQLQRLHSKIDSFDTEKQTAVFSLICEHARLNGEFDTTVPKPTLPYGIKRTSSGCSIDLNSLPSSLQVILYRFIRTQRSR